RWLETRGYPAAAGIPRNPRDLGRAARLWARSEELTGVRFWSE
ncbi:short-chain dehydrogenase, partial [Pseudomonas aeruginosa]|nr:short-chain dehydrogenase [Pseudomonas aeruginosa]